MPIIVKRAVSILFIACLYSALAQQATVTRSVVLHRDPSAKSKALEHLNEGDRLTLVDAAPDAGFYHVKTEDDQVGWVASKYVNVSTSAPLPPDGNRPAISKSV